MERTIEPNVGYVMMAVVLVIGILGLYGICNVAGEVSAQLKNNPCLIQIATDYCYNANGQPFDSIDSFYVDKSIPTGFSCSNRGSNIHSYEFTESDWNKCGLS